MLGSIKYNLTHLLDFDGRDARQTFWFYMLFVVICQFLVGIFGSIPMYVSIFTQAFDAASNGANEAAMMSAMTENMIEAVETQLWVSAVTTLIAIGLLAASFVRRLHDAGFTGWIAAIPVVVQIYALYATFANLDQVKDMMRASITSAENGAPVDPMAMQAELGWSSLVGWIAIIVVIGFGVLKSQDGPNKYGTEPVRF